jgi:CheY-like chemotaxis protein
MIEPILENMTILLVDDEPDNLAVMEELLMMMGARVITASNGKQGLQQAVDNAPDVIMSDLSMPEMSGWELLFRLQKRDATKDIPVIALTAHAMAGDKERVLDAGFANYIAKPIDMIKLVTELPEMLKGIPTVNEKLYN